MTVAASLRISDLDTSEISDISVLDGTAAGPLTVTGGDWLLHAGFARHGFDLNLTGADGHHLLVRDYFAQGQLPDLVTDHGAVIDGSLAARLAGPLAPGQYAQAGGGGSDLVFVGTVSKLTGEVEARHADGTSTPVKNGDSVYEGDVLITGAGGRIGITFVDGSVFSLGANGRMTVDEMAYDPKAGTGSEKMSVVTGSFTFMSGEVAKTAPDAMSVKTPVATIGIRGTTVYGVAAAEGKSNTYSLMPDPNGSVGQFAVITKAGVQLLSAAGATTQLASAFVPPPPPEIKPLNQIQALYTQAREALPPPPTPQQQQQMQQQYQQQPKVQQQQQQQAPQPQKQGATDKAAQQAKATADAKATGEAKATAEQAAKIGAREKALAGKAEAEKAAIAKVAPGKVPDVIAKVLGTSVGKFGVDKMVADPNAKGLATDPFAKKGRSGDDPFAKAKGASDDPFTKAKELAKDMKEDKAKKVDASEAEGKEKKEGEKEGEGKKDLVEKILDAAKGDMAERIIKNVKADPDTKVEKTIEEVTTKIAKDIGMEIKVGLDNAIAGTAIGQQIANTLDNLVSLAVGQMTNQAMAQILADPTMLTMASQSAAIANQIAGQLATIGTMIPTAINTVVQQQVQTYEQIAASRPTKVWPMSGTITLASGYTNYFNGINGTNDTVTVIGTLNSDYFHDTSPVDQDTVYVGSGGRNVFGIENIENVNLSAAGTYGNEVGVYSNGNVSFTLSSGSDVITATASSTGDHCWTFTGNFGTGDALQAGPGSDSIVLATAGTHVLALNRIEYVSLSNTSAYDLTLSATTDLGGVSITGNAGADILRLQTPSTTAITIDNIQTVYGNSGNDVVKLYDGNQTVTVNGVETLTGGTGTDVVTLDGGGTITVTGAIETLTGSGGADTIVLGANTVSGMLIDGGAGSDIVTLSAASTITVMNVETITGSSGNDSLSVKAAAGGTTVDGGSGTDELWLSDVGGTFTITGIESVVGGTGNDVIKFASTTGLVSISGGGGTDSIQGAASLTHLDLSAVTLTNAGTIASASTSGVTITGSSGNDTIASTAATGFTDTLIGGQGADALSHTASGGATVFRYIAATAAEGGDTIAAFTSGTDKFQFDHTAFGNLSVGQLAAGSFVSGAGATANQAAPQFIFDTTAKTLSYDADGTGGGAAVTIATIASGTPTDTDIVIT
jgi:Ca2+-binding RTX toxin-like protein